MALLVVGLWPALFPAIRAEAIPLGPAEVQAMDQWANWVADTCTPVDSSATTTTPSSAPISGDLQSLAKQVLANNKITYDFGPRGPTAVQFRRLSNGQKAQTDTGRQVDVQPILLVALLHLAQSHKVQVSALTNGSSHTAPDNPHGMGDAMDIDFLDGAGTDGSDAVANRIISSLEEVLPSGSRFGMGNNPFGTQKVNGKTFTSFTDNPNHVHFDVVGVSQAADDRAVQDAGGASTPPAVSSGSSGSSGCCGSSSGATATLAAPGNMPPDNQLPGNNNRQKIWNYLTGTLGFTPVQAAGIEGNIAVEGVYDPQNIEDPAGRTKDPSNLTGQNQGWGLIGFTPGNSIFGAPWDSSGVKVTKDNVYFISTQLNVVYGYMKNNKDSGSGKSMLEAYQNQATDAPAAALAFMNIVENPNSALAHEPRRENAAKQLMQDFGTSGAAVSDSGAAACCPNTSGASFGPGTLPSSVPKPYNAIFTAAGNKHNIDPALVAAIFYGGEHGNSWPDPPPPYGHGGPWASSSAGAQGPFQFIPSTWSSYGEDGNGDGKKDVQDLTDGAFGAAHYLYASGARGSDQSTFRKAIFAYNHASWYVDNVMNAYKKFSTGGAAGGGGGGSVAGTSSGCDQSPTGYQNPLRDVKGLFKRRIDQGVDYGGHGNIYAIGPGIVANAYHLGSSDSGWPGGGWVSYTLTDGPAKGKIVYFAESCDPKVKRGDRVDSNTVICYMSGDNSPWIETGWAASSSVGDTQPLAQLYGGDGCCSTTAGVNFSDLLKSLGAPPGILTDNPPKGTPLPASFPTWH